MESESFSGTGSSNMPPETGDQLPTYMRLSSAHLLLIIGYSILLTTSTLGNALLLYKILQLQKKGRLNRVNLMILHLAIADLIVTFIMMPMEIAWNRTVMWNGGDFFCRFYACFQTFGLYLSGFILICISFDRYFAIICPLPLPDANKRSIVMLRWAWICAVLFSLPQSIIVHVENHPTYTWYEQCVTFNSFSSKELELTYNYIGFVIMYALPVVVIIFCYVSILYKLWKVSRMKKNGDAVHPATEYALTKAKVSTMVMTLIIAATFSFCYTPFNVMSVWYWIDRESAMKVDERIQKGCFLFASSNCCFYPLIYGYYYAHQKKNELLRPLFVAQNGRIQQIERPTYGFVVRWQRPGYLCPAASDAISSSNNAKPRPRQEISMGNQIPSSLVHHHNLKELKQHRIKSKKTQRHYSNSRTVLVEYLEGRRKRAPTQGQSTVLFSSENQFHSSFTTTTNFNTH